MRQKENYKVRHHFYNTIITSNSPQTPKKQTEWLMSKPQERKKGLRVTRPSSLSSRAKTPVLSVKSFTLTAGRGCVEVKSPWVPQLRTHTHTHTHTQTPLMSLVSGFYLFSTHIFFILKHKQYNHQCDSSRALAPAEQPPLRCIGMLTYDFLQVSKISLTLGLSLLLYHCITTAHRDISQPLFSLYYFDQWGKQSPQSYSDTWQGWWKCSLTNHLIRS